VVGKAALLSTQKRFPPHKAAELPVQDQDTQALSGKSRQAHCGNEKGAWFLVVSARYGNVSFTLGAEGSAEQARGALGGSA